MLPFLEKNQLACARSPSFLLTQSPFRLNNNQVEAAVNEAVRARPDEPLSFLVSLNVEKNRKRRIEERAATEKKGKSKVFLSLSLPVFLASACSEFQALALRVKGL